MIARIAIVSAFITILVSGASQKACAQDVAAQDTVRYSVACDGQGFMCPFLTPIFVDRLKKEGALNVTKDSQLVIHFDAVPTSTLTPDKVKEMAASVGYMESIIHVNTTR
jgi:hypothetical protein